MVLSLKNLFLLLHYLFNLVNLGFFNKYKIFYDNENKTLYDKSTKKSLAYPKRWKTSFFFYLFNLFAFAIYFLQIDNNIYKWLIYVYKTTTLLKLSHII